MTGPRSGPRQSLSYYLSVITRIRNPVLREQQEPTTCPVAERMSWAAHRKTTRIEDQAYCLLGIFNVSIPLIYGEGGHAFQRLQEEIMKTTEEYSLFVSRLSGPRALSSGARVAQKQNPQVPHASKSLLNNLANNAAIVPQGLFAASALDFDVRLRAPDGEHLSSLDLELADSYLAVGKAGLGEDTPTMTGRGLRVRLFIFETKGLAGLEENKTPVPIWLAYLNCKLEGKPICAALLREQSERMVYIRVRTSDIGRLSLLRAGRPGQVWSHHHLRQADQATALDAAFDRQHQFRQQYCCGLASERPGTPPKTRLSDLPRST